MDKKSRIKLIAEIGINHNGSIDVTKKLIKMAGLAGFDYVKFQKRNPDICVPERQKNIPKDTPWGEMSYLDYKKKIEFGIDDYILIDIVCKQNRLDWFASVWDLDSAAFMKQFCNIVKIPSALITHLELLKYCRENYDTVLMSTGMSTEAEIEKAVEVGDPDVIFHTNSAYPSPVKELNLKYINWLKLKYPDKQIGYSGHEFGLSTTYTAAGMGLDWIERHVTLDHEMWGSDQKSSIDPVGMIKLCRTIRDIEKSLTGNKKRVIFNSEKSKRESLRK